MLKKFTQFQFLPDPDLSHFFKLFSGFICNRYNEAEETNIYKQVSREAVKGRALWRVWHPFKCSLNTQLPFYRILQDPHFTTEKEDEEISWDLWAGCLTFWRCWLRVPLVACDNSVTIVLLYVMSETIVSVIVITVNWKIPATAVEVLMFGSYGAGDLDPKALNKLIGNQCLGPLYCTLGTGSCKP